MVPTEGTPDHDGTAAEDHLILDCHINKTFPTMPPGTQPPIFVVECKARFVAEEDLSPLLTISVPPHMTPEECAASPSVCGRQAWSYCWATGTEVHSMQAVPDGLPANVYISGRPQLPSDGAGRGSSGL